MAALHVVAFIFLTVIVLGRGFGLSDEEFQVSFIAQYMNIHKCRPFNCLSGRFTQAYVDSL